jgi:hypothetical protein
MKDLKERMRHFHAWAGIQRTRHEHRCAVTQPNPQDFSTTDSMSYSRVSRTIRPPAINRTRLQYFAVSFFSIFIPRRVQSEVRVKIPALESMCVN